MTPYYKEAGVTLYLGDARQICKHVAQTDSVITDPVWPNCEHVFPGIDAAALLADVLFPLLDVKRVAIHLGCVSDPRFLSSVPSRWKYLRTCYLEYAVKGYLGRILKDAEVAYVFGAPPPSKPGAHVLPGRVIATKASGGRTWGKSGRNSEETGAIVAALPHPAARNLQHVRWLCKWFGGDSILDPLCGSGTTLVAAKALGIPCVGIEIEERFCELAVSRLSQSVIDLQEVSA